MLRVDRQHAGNSSIQGFAPNRVEAATNTLDTTTVLAFCPGVDISYTINGAGTSASIKAGAVRVIGEGVTSIVFSGPVTCEVMDV